MMECKAGATLLPSFRELTASNVVDHSPADGSTDISSRSQVFIFFFSFFFLYQEILLMFLFAMNSLLSTDA